MPAPPPAAAMLHAILDATANAIVSTDLDSTITSWNAAAERMYGYPAADAVGQSILSIFPPERVDEEQDILRRVRSGERIRQLRTIRRRRDGSGRTRALRSGFQVHLAKPIDPTELMDAIVALARRSDLGS